MNNPKEWRDIKGYEGRYEIRMIEEEPYCEIRSKTKFKKNLKQYIYGGYRCVNLYEDPKKNLKRKKVHRLIAIQYIPNIEGKETINHKNGIKTDNRIENLEWNTLMENYAHVKENKLLNLFQNGENHSGFKGSIEVYKDGEYVKTLRGKTEITNEGFTDSRVYEYVNGKKESYNGFTFKRKTI